MIGSFTAADLLSYAESLLKESRLQEMRAEDSSHYGWLKSKHLQHESVDVYLEELRPIILKMSPENCAAVAVKLDILTEASNSTDHILTTLKNLVQEQDNMHVLAEQVRRAKETKGRKVRVHPIFMPPGRQPTVSFVVNDDTI